MEPRRDEPQKAQEPSAERKPNRFRIVKLEERIAPSKGGNTGGKTCACTSSTCLCGASLRIECVY